MPRDQTWASGEARTPSMIPLVELAGTASETGRQHGEQLREAIGLFYDDLLDHMCSDGVTTEEDLLSYARGHLPAAKQYAPEIVAELQGIAEGARLAFDQLLLITCHDEVSCHGPSLLTRGLHGCTAFAATGRASLGGTCIVGQSWDVPPYSPPYLFRVLSSSGVAKLMPCHPGMIGGAGSNSSGLALTWTTLEANDARLGGPAPFVVRKALEADDLGELIGNALSAYRANGMGFIAEDMVAAVNIEMSATRYHVTHSHGILGRANHYESPALVEFEDDLPVAGPDTIPRRGRMNELLEEHAGTIDREVMMAILCDHASAPSSICYHEHDGWRTCASVICDAREGAVWASNGPPCESGFARYAVDPRA